MKNADEFTFGTQCSALCPSHFGLPVERGTFDILVFVALFMEYGFWSPGLFLILLVVVQDFFSSSSSLCVRMYSCVCVFVFDVCM